ELSPEFQPEVARLRSEGLQLREAREASLDGRAHHLAAIFERATPQDPRETYELRIIESDGRSVATIFRRPEFFFTFSASPELSALNATDINGDGFREVIAESSSGGNCWECNPVEIYRVANHKAELIAAGPIQKIVDLDHDGISELVVTDARWESYGDLAHAASPWSTIIYAWRGGRYVDASSDFPDYYKDQIGTLTSRLNEAKSVADSMPGEEPGDDSYIGVAISIAITYAHLGDTERAVQQLKALLLPDGAPAKNSERRQKILKDFESGDSAAKLRSSKHGDPLLTR
ncbi:MAG TPA: hypothetical protein VJX67_05530, partial [Blastocatellia bacterium]|nr:hypothetical protein [Blastocatellia bacterium]